MRWLVDIPIRRKLLLITVMASAIALLLAEAVLVAYEVYTYRAQKAGDRGAVMQQGFAVEAQ